MSRILLGIFPSKSTEGENVQGGDVELCLTCSVVGTISLAFETKTQSMKERSQFQAPTLVYTAKLSRNRMLLPASVASLLSARSCLIQ